MHHSDLEQALTVLPLDVFIPCFTMTRVSRISLNILANKLFRRDCLAYIRPFGETTTSFSQAESFFSHQGKTYS